MAVVPVVPGAVRWIESLDGAHALLIVEHSGSIELLLQQGKNILFSVLGCKAEDCISSLASLGGEELSFPPVLRDVILKKGGDGFIGKIPEGYKMQGYTAIGVGTNRIQRLRALSLSLVLSAGCVSPEIRSDIARAEEAYPGIVAACNAAINAWGAPEAAPDQRKDTNAWGRSEAAEAAAKASEIHGIKATTMVRYLPEFVKGERCLTPQTEANAYKYAHSCYGRLAYRRKEDMDDRDTERSVRKNEIVKGELSNGWLKVELNEASDHDWQSGWDFATASLKKSVARPASLKVPTRVRFEWRGGTVLSAHRTPEPGGRSFFFTTFLGVCSTTTGVYMGLLELFSNLYIPASGTNSSS